MKKEKMATVPKLVCGADNKWYIYFRVLDVGTGKMKAVRIFNKLNGSHISDINARKALAAEMVDEYTDKLRAGWSPLDDRKDVIYADNIEYQALSKTFKTMRKGVRNHTYYMNIFLEDVEKTVMPSTFKTYRSKMRIYCEWLRRNGYGEYDVSAVGQVIVKEFMLFIGDKLKRDRLTVEKYIQILKAFYEYVRKQRRISVNPVYDIPRPVKRVDMAARPVNDIDMKVLLEAIRPDDPQLYLACMFQYYMAIRPGTELRLLKVKDLDLFNKRVVVNDVHAKVQRRVVDMPRQLAALCEEYLIHRYNKEYYVFGRSRQPGPEPTGKNTLRVRFNVFRDKLGLPDIYKFYSMKHTGGGKLLNSGATIEEIRMHFGHERIETTDRYLRRHFGQRNPKIINNFPDPM